MNSSQSGISYANEQLNKKKKKRIESRANRNYRKLIVIEYFVYVNPGFDGAVAVNPCQCTSAYVCV